jgi:hypothetical protein
MSDLADPTPVWQRNQDYRRGLEDGASAILDDLIDWLDVHAELDDVGEVMLEACRDQRAKIQEHRR